MEKVPVNSVSIIIPTYQEVGNINALIKSISEVDFTSIPFEVIIVDDHSQDGTVQVIKQQMQIYPWLRLVERQGERDLSRSIIEGFQHAEFNVLVTMDADLSHPPKLIPELVSTLLQPNVDFVIGSRYVPGGSTGDDWPAARKLSSRLAAYVARIILGIHVKDPLSGFIAIRRDTYLHADSLNPIGWKIGLEIMVKSHCKNIREIPIHFSQRYTGSSKLDWKIALDYFWHVLSLLKYKFMNKFSLQKTVS